MVAGIARAQRRLRLDPPEPLNREPSELMRMLPLLDPTHRSGAAPSPWVHPGFTPGFRS